MVLGFNQLRQASAIACSEACATRSTPATLFVLARLFFLCGRLCENSFGALRPSSGRTVKYFILIILQLVCAEATRSMDGVFTQSGDREQDAVDMNSPNRLTSTATVL